MVEGLSRGLTLDLPSLSISPKVTPSHCMHKCTADAYSSSFMFGFQIGSIFVVDPGQELQPERPATRMILMGLVGDALFLAISAPATQSRRYTLAGVGLAGSVKGEERGEVMLASR